MPYKIKHNAAQRTHRAGEAVVVCGPGCSSAGQLSLRRDKIRIRETVSSDVPPAELREKILAAGTVILTGVPQNVRDELVRFCFERDIRCYLVPTVSDVMMRSGRTVRMTDTTLLLFSNAGLTARQRMQKRLFDILAAVAAIGITWPLMVLIALAILLEDGGPVLFTQDRLTEKGRIFRIYKFRSMRVQARQRSYVLTRKNDSRLTSVGKVIRRMHLDELPQLVNILKGEMSFVGPRPECPDLAAQYREIIPQFDYRLKARAGLTGYAQVHGKYNSAPGEKLKMDLYYITNYSFALDMKLMLQTVKILFRREKSEGIDPWQTSAAPETMGNEA